jgi:hypothetical protein
VRDNQYVKEDEGRKIRRKEIKIGRKEGRKNGKKEAQR